MFILIYFSVFFNQYAFDFILRERWFSFSKWWYLNFWGIFFFPHKVKPWLNCLKQSKYFSMKAVGHKHYICKISSLWAELEQHLKGHIVMYSFVKGLFIKMGFAFTWNSDHLYQHSCSGVTNVIYLEVMPWEDWPETGTGKR